METLKMFINNREFTIELETYIESIALYGSCARGECDTNSDIDILIIIDDSSSDQYNEIKEKISKEMQIPVKWISLYTKHAILNMKKYSSYFLWHLKLEAIIFYSKSNLLEDVLQNLKEYTKMDSDLQQYLVIYKDIESSIHTNNKTYQYELSLLASLIRNTCMAFCYKNKILNFGRIEPVIITKQKLNKIIDFTIDEYNELYEFRSLYNKGILKELEVNKVNSYVEKWLDRTKKLIINVIDYDKEN
jgi:predicted nucleotidyltransferase